MRSPARSAMKESGKGTMNESTPHPEPMTAGAFEESGAAERLYQLWRQGGRPDVDAFLASAGALPPTEAAAVLRVDQRSAGGWARLYPPRRTCGAITRSRPTPRRRST